MSGIPSHGRGMKQKGQKVVPIRQQLADESTQSTQAATQNSSSQKVEVVRVGKLKFTVYTNTPSDEAMDNFNEFFQNLFETTIKGDESDALPA